MSAQHSGAMKRNLYEKPEAEELCFNFHEDFLAGTLDSMDIIDETLPEDRFFEDEYEAY